MNVNTLAVGSKGERSLYSADSGPRSDGDLMLRYRIPMARVEFHSIGSAQQCLETFYYLTDGE